METEMVRSSGEKDKTQCIVGPTEKMEDGSECM